jgi:DNA-binding MarR family transcriptional regulator
VPPHVERHDLHTRRLLTEVEAGNGNSQRSLARELGIALGLTNLLLRRVVRKGWVKATNIQRNRVRYLITPAGITEKARISREYLAASVKLYSEARDRIQHTLSGLSRNWPAGAADKPIVFFGGGEVAEIGYVCLHETDLRLVGVIDEVRTTPFFGVPVYPVDRLSPFALENVSYGRIIVMSFADHGSIRQALENRGIAAGLVEWI